jgi:hypothetical protein
MGMKNMQKLMKQAQAMQEKLEGEMGELRIETSAGGGVVNIIMDGSKQLLSIHIDPEAVDPNDVEMLQDLVLTAVNDGIRKVDDTLSSRLGGMVPGLS